MAILNGSIQLLMVTFQRAIWSSINKLIQLQTWLLQRAVQAILTTIELFLRVPHLILLLQVKLLETLHQIAIDNYSGSILLIRIMLSLWYMMVTINRQTWQLLSFKYLQYLIKEHFLWYTICEQLFLLVQQSITLEWLTSIFI